MYVFSVDEDANMVTEDDRELYAVTYDEIAGWSAVNRLTNDSVLDANPQVKLTGGGNLLLVWYREPNIVSADDLILSDVQTVIQTSQSSGAVDFRLARNATGLLSLLWTDTSSEGVDIWTAGYDGAFSLWGKAYQLTADHDMEHSLSPVYDSNNNLCTAYNRINIIDNNGVPIPSTVDLYLMRHQIGGDLAVSADGISLSKSNPMPGTTVDVNAVINNIGDIAAENITVNFYEGNPVTDGTLIDSYTIEGPVAAADSATTSVQWQVPEVNQPLDLYVVVDPNYEIEDSNRSNNVASTTALMPDLTIREVYSQKVGPKLRVITARVANDGPVPVVNIPAVLRLESPEGMPLASFYIPSLAEGAYQDVSFEWDTTGEQFSGSEVPVYAIVDLSNGIAEFNEENNILFAQVSVTNIADFSDNGTVDTLDLGILAEEWLAAEDLSADISPSGGDNFVNFLDFAIFAQNWLESTTP
jgi:hypothetical protein